MKISKNESQAPCLPSEVVKSRGQYEVVMYAQEEVRFNVSRSYGDSVQVRVCQRTATEVTMLCKSTAVIWLRTLSCRTYDKQRHQSDLSMWTWEAKTMLADSDWAVSDGDWLNVPADERGEVGSGVTLAGPGIAQRGLMMLWSTAFLQLKGKASPYPFRRFPESPLQVDVTVTRRTFLTMFFFLVAPRRKK